MRNYFSKLLLWTLIITPFGLAGCSPGGAPEEPTPTAPAPSVMKPGDYQQTIAIDGTIRSYILHIPPSYDGSSARPLMFVLHGYGGSAGNIMKSTGMNDKADQEIFFAVYLQSTVGAGSKPAWNTGLTPNLGITVDDVAFVRTLLTRLKGQLLVDSKRVYAAGFSNGGMMSHRLGAELHDILAGVAIVAGTIGISPDNGASFYTIPEAKGPIPVMMIHGVQDPNIKYYGGQGEGSAQLYVKSVAEAVAFWTGQDGCAGSPQKQVSADGNTITETYTACFPGGEVELITLVQGLHQWPTIENPGGIGGADAIWKFFDRHSKIEPI